MPSCSLDGFSAIGKVLQFSSGILFLVCNGEECLHSSSDNFLPAWWVQCDWKGSSVPVRHSLFGLHNWIAGVPLGTPAIQWWRMLDSNQWPLACQASALTCWANPPYFVGVKYVRFCENSRLACCGVRTAKRFCNPLVKNSPQDCFLNARLPFPSSVACWEYFLKTFRKCL